MPRIDVRLSEVQFAIMRVLWSVDRATTAEVFERVGKPRSLAYTTVATLLTRLEKRGLVRSTKKRTERVFQAVVSEREARRSMVSSLVSTIFDGDPSELVSHLIKEKEFGKDDLEAIRKLLAKGGEKGGK